VAYDYDNERYLAVWEDDRSFDNRGYDIYGQLVSFDGSRVGSNFRISRSNSDEFSPAVAYSPHDGRFLVVWEDNRRDDSSKDIYGQLVSFDGSRVGSNFRISRSTGDESSPALAYGGNFFGSRFLVVWQDNRRSDTNIYGQLVNYDGSRVESNFRISRSTSNEDDPAVAWDYPSERYLVVWEDNRRSDTNIYGQLVTIHGFRVGTNTRLSKGIRDKSNPDVTGDGQVYEFLVVWDDYRKSAFHRDIYGQRFDGRGDGSLLDRNFRISRSADDEWDPVVTHSSGNSEYLVAWTDDRRGNYDIYAQRLDDETTERDLPNFRISRSNGYEVKPAVAYSGFVNQYFVAWEDDRATATRGHDIYAQRVVPSEIVPNVYGDYWEDAQVDFEDAGFTNVTFSEIGSGTSGPYHEKVWGYGCEPDWEPCYGEHWPVDTAIYAFVGCHDDYDWTCPPEP
jgi:hypothetical protein